MDISHIYYNATAWDKVVAAIFAVVYTVKFARIYLTSSILRSHFKLTRWQMWNINTALGYDVKGITDDNIFRPLQVFSTSYLVFAVMTLVFSSIGWYLSAGLILVIATIFFIWMMLELIFLQRRQVMRRISRHKPSWDAYWALLQKWRMLKKDKDNAAAENLQ